MRSFSLQTPEHVTFDFELAGPGRRLCALFFDSLIILGLIAITLWLTPLVARLLGFSMAAAFRVLAAFAIVTGYYAVSEWRMRGQTFGKRAVGIRVIRDIGTRLRGEQVIARNLFRLLDAMPLFYGLGGLFCYLHPMRKRIGDAIAGTVVVVERKPVLPRDIAGVHSRHNSLLEDAALCLRIRAAVTPREREFLMQLCARREQLSDTAKLDILKQAAAFFRRRLGLETLSGAASDEGFLVNVTQVLLQAQPAWRAGKQ